MNDGTWYSQSNTFCDSFCRGAVGEQAGSTRSIAGAAQKPASFIPSKDFPEIGIPETFKQSDIMLKKTAGPFFCLVLISTHLSNVPGFRPKHLKPGRERHSPSHSSNFAAKHPGYNDERKEPGSTVAAACLCKLIMGRFQPEYSLH